MSGYIKRFEEWLEERYGFRLRTYRYVDVDLQVCINQEYMNYVEKQEESYESKYKSKVALQKAEGISRAQ